MRGYKTLIQEAELMAMSPEAVAEFLKVRAGQFKEVVHPVDEELEKALLSRAEPLITLAVARYGRYMDVVSEIFKTAGANTPIRVACLANRSLIHDVFQYPSFPVGLFGREPRPMAEWLLTASGDELCALMENTTLSDSFLWGLLKRDRGWEAIPDRNLCFMVSILHRNPRMRTPREDDWMDGEAESSYRSVFEAAWSLAATAPVTNGWAFALGALYEQLQTDVFSIKEPLKLAERWHIALDDVAANEQQAKEHKYGNLGDMERVRKGLARLALSKSRELLAELLDNDDIAFRAATYAVGNINADQLRAGYEKDGEIVFDEAIRNISLWRNQSTRQALRSIAWSKNNSDLRRANQYNRIEKDMRGKHPNWFADE